MVMASLLLSTSVFGLPVVEKITQYQQVISGDCGSTYCTEDSGLVLVSTITFYNESCDQLEASDFEVIINKQSSTQEVTIQLKQPALICNGTIQKFNYEYKTTKLNLAGNYILMNPSVLHITVPVIESDADLIDLPF